MICLHKIVYSKKNIIFANIWMDGSIIEKSKEQRKNVVYLYYKPGEKAKAEEKATKYSDVFNNFVH